tara:strand:- start:25428 stop:25535 length:108 start_codon:yes stop_codon:yes gene_type:complete
MLIAILIYYPIADKLLNNIHKFKYQRTFLEMIFDF